MDRTWAVSAAMLRFGGGGGIIAEIGEIISP
jgi:hypothetical protein